MLCQKKFLRGSGIDLNKRVYACVDAVMEFFEIHIRPDF